MTIIIIVLLAVFLLAVVAAPLLNRELVDDLPDLRDPVTVDLEEERDALLRAIRELDARTDMAVERRDELRTRYESKAARVLRQLDERITQQAGKAPARERQTEPRRVPWGGLALALVSIGIAAGLGTWVLPRTGQATVTSFFQSDLDSARELQALQQAAASDPNAPNLLALGDFYWQTGDVQGVEETYREAVETLQQPPAVALKRLALLELNDDPEAALALLEQSAAADNSDPETLFYLGELQLMFGDYEASRATWTQFDLVDSSLDDNRAELRLALLDDLIPLSEEMQRNPNADTLASIGDAWWDAGEQDLAADAYFGVLTEYDPLHTRSLSRLGQVLFTAGQIDEAVIFLERAYLDGTQDADALLFLGNGQYTLGEYEAAISAWNAYVDVVGGPESAGRVPGLIEDAEARLRGETPAEPEAQQPQQAPQPQQTVSEEVTARQLYANHCAECHGSNAAGGTGPALAGSERATDAAMVQNTVRFGRGAMPGFMAVLSSDEINLLVDYVTLELAGQ